MHGNELISEIYGQLAQLTLIYLVVANGLTYLNEPAAFSCAVHRVSAYFQYTMIYDKSKPEPQSHTVAVSSSNHFKT